MHLRPRRAKLSSMTDQKNDPKQEQEISNVDLQFQSTGSQSQGEPDAEVQAENVRAGEGEFREHGLSRYDVVVEDSMDASDAPSTNMGDQG